MIIGVGVDLVDLARFERAITRTPRLIDRLFTASERNGSMRTLAGRFAAKEAMIKAVGDPRGMRWHEVEVLRDPIGKPTLTTHGATASIADAAGTNSWHVSISHDGGKAVAVVVAEAK